MYLVPQEVYSRLLENAGSRDQRTLAAANSISGDPVLENSSIHNTNIRGPITINNCPPKRSIPNISKGKGGKGGKKEVHSVDNSATQTVQLYNDTSTQTRIPSRMDVGTESYLNPYTSRSTQTAQPSMAHNSTQSSILFDNVTQTPSIHMVDASTQNRDVMTTSTTQTEMAGMQDMGIQTNAPSFASMGVQTETTKPGINVASQIKPKVFTKRVQTKEPKKKSKHTQHSSMPSSTSTPSQTETKMKQDMSTQSNSSNIASATQTNNYLPSKKTSHGSAQTMPTVTQIKKAKLPFKLSKGAMRDVQDIMSEHSNSKRDQHIVQRESLNTRKGKKRQHSPEHVRLSKLPHSKLKQSRMYDMSVVDKLDQTQKKSRKRALSPETVQLSKLPHSKEKQQKREHDFDNYDSWL